MRITVIGGGSWGTALASLWAAKGLDLTLLVRSPALAEEINTQHTNTPYLPGHVLPANLVATTDPQKALVSADICLLATPCQHLRSVLQVLAPFVPASAIVVCASKGIEIAGLCRMAEVVGTVLPEQSKRYAMLSGPSFAKEVATGKPTALALGCTDQALGETLREAFSTPLFRVYSCLDLIGVELGGAIKNVFAIAAGLCDGLDLGHNARAALITRGLAEMSRLGVAMGAKPATFMGLSGLGDLVLTCTGDLSRNRQTGLRLSRGETLQSIANSTNTVAEGVPTTKALCTLAKKQGVDLPLTQAVYRVLYEQTLPAAIVTELMGRALREE